MWMASVRCPVRRCCRMSVACSSYRVIGVVAIQPSIQAPCWPGAQLLIATFSSYAGTLAALLGGESCGAGLSPFSPPSFPRTTAAGFFRRGIA